MRVVGERHFVLMLERNFKYVELNDVGGSQRMYGLRCCWPPWTRISEREDGGDVILLPGLHGPAAETRPSNFAVCKQYCDELREVIS